MDLQQAIVHALDGDSVCFLGSGFSREAKNSSGQNFPAGKALLDVFNQLLGRKFNYLDIASDFFLSQHSNEALVDFLVRQFSLGEISDNQKAFGSIPWRKIYTTNYDLIVEQAYLQNKRSCVSVSLSDELALNKANADVCIHLNGRINKLNSANVNNEIKLTRESYFTESIIDSPWVSIFRNDIEFAKSIFFIGYSLYDIDIARILASSPHTKSKTFFIMAPGEDFENVHTAQRFGQILEIGFDRFIENIIKIKEIHIKKEIISSFFSFGELHISDTYQKPTDNDVFDLWVNGRYDFDLLFHSYSSVEKYHYSIPRSYSKKISECFLSGIDHIVIYGNLGTGKSIICDQVAINLLREGYRVFFFRKKYQNIVDEILALSRIQDRFLIIFDDYHSHIDIIKKLSANTSNRVKLLYTSRTSVHEFYNERLLEALKTTSIMQFDIEKMSIEDLDFTLLMMNEYGYWGDQAGLSDDRKKLTLREKNKSELPNILLTILNSSDIKQRLTQESDKICETDETALVALLALALTVLSGGEVSLTTLSDLLGADLVNKAVKIHTGDANIAEFLTFKGGRCMIRSPIVSKFILKSLRNSQVFINSLKIAMYNLDVLRIHSTDYRNLFTEMMRFGNIESILPDKGKREFVINYYEEIKNLKGSSKNPFFWLQYAIARLALNDYPKAELYFKNAYSYLNTSDKGTTIHIDNHYARFLLERRIGNFDENFMIDFSEAHKIIFKQMKSRNNKHYPYRVARKYLDFLNVYEQKMTSSNVTMFLSFCKQIESTYVSASSTVKEHMYFKECKKITTECIERLSC